MECMPIVLLSDITLISLFILKYFVLVEDAFDRKKQIKAGSRKKKIQLIESINPEWKDLFENLNSNSGEELIRLKKFFR